MIFDPCIVSQQFLTVFYSIYWNKPCQQLSALSYMLSLDLAGTKKTTYFYDPV
jgi:hypothetical protein